MSPRTHPNDEPARPVAMTPIGGGRCDVSGCSASAWCMVACEGQQQAMCQPHSEGACWWLYRSGKTYQVVTHAAAPVIARTETEW